jgi:hypothetical protein
MIVMQVLSAVMVMKLVLQTHVIVYVAIVCAIIIIVICSVVGQNLRLGCLLQTDRLICVAKHAQIGRRSGQR